MFDHAIAGAVFFRFLRQPSQTNAPRPLAKSGNAAGKGVLDTSETTMLSSPLFTSPMMGSALKKPINVDGPVAMNVVENCFQLSIALGSLFVADKYQISIHLEIDRAAGAWKAGDVSNPE